MKTILIGLLFILSGCSSTYEDIGQNYVNNLIVKNNQDPNSLKQSCIMLGKCMGGKYSLIHLPKQTHAPYACEIILDEVRNEYFYPDAELGFGMLSFFTFTNAITTCEMLKHSGNFSDESIAKKKEMFKQLDKEAEERKKPKKAISPEIVVKELED